MTGIFSSKTKLVIESRLRISGSTSDFTVNIPDYLKIRRARLIESTIPSKYLLQDQ